LIFHGASIEVQNDISALLIDFFDELRSLDWLGALQHVFDVCIDDISEARVFLCDLSLYERGQPGLQAIHWEIILLRIGDDFHLIVIYRNGWHSGVGDSQQFSMSIVQIIIGIGNQNSIKEGRRNLWKNIVD
jgi:hypothetical protein